MTSLSNVSCAYELRAIAREKRSRYDSRTVSSKLAEEMLTDGWDIERKNKSSIRFRREKSHDRILEDRVWSLYYAMGFSYLSGNGGAKLFHSTGDLYNQLDVVVLDEETALVVECKSSVLPAKRSSFQNEVAKLAQNREPFARVLRIEYPGTLKRRIGLVMFLSNAILSDTDKARASQNQVVVFTEGDLDYYEDLVNQVGKAARYQFLADVFQGKEIPGLEIKIPAIRSKMASHTCYSFSISPEYLIKIAYISHRSKGKASDVDSYQRMIKKTRLRDIRQYIDSGEGIFPTNIVINLDEKCHFDQTSQQGSSDGDILGWLTLRPHYKFAWVIDGQHRLFAYVDSPRASTSRPSVLAFEQLPASEQAQLFVDINAKQRSVKQSLLEELFAELHWDSNDPAVRLKAVISKAIQVMANDVSSPFYRRIMAAEDKSDPKRCISLTTLFRSLDHPELFVSHTRKAKVPVYGPLYAGDDNNATLKRICAVMNNWFGHIRMAAPDWWDLGRDEGGGLSMNDSLAAQILVLRSVFAFLTQQGNHLDRMEDMELVDRLEPFATVVADYLVSLSVDDRKRFRELRGIQGQVTRARRSQLAIFALYPGFDFPDLKKFRDEESSNTNNAAGQLIREIETLLQMIVLEELRREFGTDESEWWTQGIPKTARVKATRMYEEDDGKRGGCEFYLDLIEYRDIAMENWTLFADLLGRGSANVSKANRTKWIVEVNESRKIAMHASSGKSVSLEQLSQLEQFRDWLKDR